MLGISPFYWVLRHRCRVVDHLDLGIAFWSGFSQMYMAAFILGIWGFVAPFILVQFNGRTLDLTGDRRRIAVWKGSSGLGKVASIAGAPLVIPPESHSDVDVVPIKEFRERSRVYGYGCLKYGNWKNN